MEVILIEPVRKLGNVGDVVKVKNGFARNYLIPTNKALRSTKENVALFEAKKAEFEKKNKENQSAAEKAAKAIEGKFVALTRQAGEDGRLYGSVTALDIARGLQEAGNKEIEKNQVTLNTPIKYIGVYEIEVHLHTEVIATINVNVARSATEAKDAEKRFKAGEKVMEGPDAEAEAKEAATSKQQEKEAKEEAAKEVKAEESAEKDPKEAKPEETTEEKVEAAAEEAPKEEEAKK